MITILKQTRERAMPDLNIDRINELYRKSKAEGLTDAEKKEQQLLRQQYVAAIRGSIRSQLNQIDMQMEDGTIVNLGEKYGKKAGREG
jgi:uncharacterized protein YnzC (UPF0291/DUF896 family)